MRKRFKKFSRATHLHHVAAYIQEIRRQLLRLFGAGIVDFRLDTKIAFRIDIASRTPFRMFTTKNRDMQMEMRRFLQLAAGQKCFLDVGSLHGIFSLSFCAQNPESVAYAVEPSPKGYETLVRNIALNHTMNIHPKRVAFGARIGELKMHYEWIHLIASHQRQAQPVSVEMTTLDEFILHYGIKPDLIKIDVDGYEGPVISGAGSFLSNHDPVIFLELHGKWIERYQYTPDSIADLLSGYGYHFLDLDLSPIGNIKQAFNTFAKRIICIKQSTRLWAKLSLPDYESA